MREIYKTEFKAHALEVFGDTGQSGQSRIITDRGRSTLEIRKLRQKQLNPLEQLKGTVIKYEAATTSVAKYDWENA